MKARLLEAVDQGRQREKELEALVVDEPADPQGRWHAKDHLAHLSWWRRRSAKTLNAARTGGELPPQLGDDDSVTNAAVYADVKDRSAADVKADAHDSWAELRQAIEDSSDRELARAHPRQPGSQVWETVPSAVGHSATHVWSWYMDVGEQDRALDIARWATDVEGRFFTTPEQLASSGYNLACAYARAGRAREAVPLLRESFDAEPRLRDLARRDGDLDRIRDDTELKQLLAT